MGYGDDGDDGYDDDDVHYLPVPRIPVSMA